MKKVKKMPKSKSNSKKGLKGFQPRKESKSEYRVSTYLTIDEFKILEDAVKKMKTTKANFLREALLNSLEKITTTDDKKQHK
jgi:hypothetical protein